MKWLSGGARAAAAPDLDRLDADGDDGSHTAATTVLAAPRGRAAARTPLPAGVVPTLLALAAIELVLTNDVTAVAVSLPAIERTFDTDVAAVQWLLTSYAVAYGVLVVTAGRLADMYGRRRVLLTGGVLFAACALAAGLAPTMGLLILARLGMGLAGALMWPAIVGLVYATVPEDRAALAGALVMGVAGVGNALGPVLGGLLTDTWGWRAVLLVDVPAALLACVVVRLRVGRDPGAARQHLDTVGVAWLSVGLLAALVALSVVGDAGGGLVVAGVLGVVAIAATVGFARRQRRLGDSALVPPSVVGNRAFRTACVASVLMATTWFTALLYLPGLFQKIDGDTVLATGVALLPLTVTNALASFGEAPLVRRLGLRSAVVIGGGLIVGGVVLLAALLAPGAGDSTLLPGMVVLGSGIGLFYAAITTAGVTALPPERTSLAGAVMYMFQQVGGSIGLGLTTMLFVVGSNRSVSREAAQLGIELTRPQRRQVRGILTGTDTANAILGRFPGDLGDRLVDVVRGAFTTGLRWGLLFNAALALAGLVVVLTRLGGRRAGAA